VVMLILGLGLVGANQGGTMGLVMAMKGHLELAPTMGFLEGEYVDGGDGF
jgi:hypothetical protein